MFVNTASILFSSVDESLLIIIIHVHHDLHVLVIFSVNTRTYQFWSVVQESGAVSQQISR